MVRQNYVAIDMDAIRHNYQILKQKVPANVCVMPVIKANAYGHGMLETATALSAMGANHFAVALPEEGIELRLGGVKGEILVLGAAMPRALEDAVRYDLTQTVFTPEMVRALEKEAAAQGKQALMHIKLDTGMNRIGLRTDEEAQALAEALEKAPHVRATGIYTHFADADNPLEDGGMNAFTRRQLERFIALRAYFGPGLTAHVANSAMSLLAPEAYFGMIREGISLYGYPPVRTNLPFIPALSWHAEVVHVKTISAGETIGYGRTFTAERDMRIATVAVGYGDGYHRAASNRGEMLIRGRRVPIVGRVCMDQTMVDVTGLEQVAVGDDVVLLGRQGEDAINAEELAAWAQTISYEVLLAITSRVPRIYLNA
ncbi:MAG: alanine racemase [Clostridiales bacterium]|nr:alanine racemase [Clostridiales bacterium]MDY4008761.1 alanine racemase [Candidatus Limiplasma sp.]